MSGVGPLRADLVTGRCTPGDVIAETYQRLRQLDPATLISFVPEEAAQGRARALQNVDPASLPLYGIPFAVKDNIDVAGVATTAGCPAYASTPDHSAEVVRRLEAAGAIAVAKTNLDQFATGLVGTRSPYGTPPNPWDAMRVPGGSSSGSAIAVAEGAVPFALGTDTAGSGRIPAAFAGIVGAKPTRGWLSTTGVVPAVRTVDCVSVFTLSVPDAWVVLAAAGGYDRHDPFSRRLAPRRPTTGRIGIGRGFAMDLSSDLLATAILGEVREVREVDLDPFLAAGRLLYGGPWVAERLAAVGTFIQNQGGEVEPTVASIITAAGQWSATDAARATYQLAALRRAVDEIWDEVDAIILPTAPMAPTLAEVAADPIGSNASLGIYTSFANLLDLCAFAIPTGVVNGLPTSVQVVAPAGADATAAALADHIHSAAGGLQGVTGDVWRGGAWAPASKTTVDIAVVGAHLRGQPLHHQLTDLDAQWIADTHTAPTYRLYALAAATPPKPGLVRSTNGNGAAIKVEVYRLTFESFGRLVAGVSPPLCIGTVVLDSGPVAGFLCEPAGLEKATDITDFGGWAAYRASL